MPVRMVVMDMPVAQVSARLRRLLSSLWRCLACMVVKPAS